MTGNMSATNISGTGNVNAAALSVSGAGYVGGASYLAGAVTFGGDVILNNAGTGYITRPAAAGGYNINMCRTGGGSLHSVSFTANTVSCSGDFTATANISANNYKSVTSGYNVARGTGAVVDNVKAQIAANGQPQMGAVSGTVNMFYSYIENVFGFASVGGVTNGGTLSTAYSNVGGRNLGNGGDTTIVHLQDQSGHLYRITYVQTVGGSNGCVVAERLV